MLGRGCGDDLDVHSPNIVEGRYGGVSKHFDFNLRLPAHIFGVVRGLLLCMLVLMLIIEFGVVDDLDFQFGGECFCSLCARSMLERVGFVSSLVARCSSLGVGCLLARSLGAPGSGQADR